ncbi:MAG: exopolysaccharide biosynthesis protein [Proteobacteria bacterium]|nr:exopolysaccharide biosynthesis protein [Pseudomonadota bacterium]
MLRPRRLALVFRRAARSLAEADSVGPDQQGRVSLGELLQLHGQQSLAVLLLVMSLFSMLPLAGVGSVLGLLMLVLAQRWRRQEHEIQLPDKLVQLRLTARWSQRSLQALTWLYATSSRLLRERLTALCEPRFAGFWGLWIAVMAIIIFLPVPLGNLVCGSSLVLLSLGWMFRDGLALLLSAAVGTGGIGLTVGVGWVAVRALLAGGDWLQRLF